MRTHIHIAIASTTSKPGEVSSNLEQIGDFAQQAGKDGADLLLTPELSASGYGSFPEVLATAEKAGTGPIYRKLAAYARLTQVVLCAGFVEAHGRKRHIAHYVVYPGGKFQVQRKHRVTLEERPLDPTVPLSGHLKGAYDSTDPGQPQKLSFNFFEIKGIRCGIAICADAGIRRLDSFFAKNGTRILLVPTGAGGVRTDCVTTAELKKEEGRTKYLKVLREVFFPGEQISRCIKYGMGFAAVNLCGFDGWRHYHLGHGAIINPMGEVVGFFHGLPNLDRQRPMYAHAEVNLSEVVR